MATELTDGGREWLGRELDKAQARDDQDLLLELALRVRHRGGMWTIPISKEIADQLSDNLRLAPESESDGA